MRLLQRTRVVVVLAALAVVCAASVWHVLRERSLRRGIPENDFFRLSPSDLRTLEWRAEFGDAESAFRVSQHYGFWVLDLKLERIWLERAARRGHRPATFSLAVTLTESRSATDRERGRTLLMQLATLGDPHALELLKVLDQPRE